MGHFSPNSGQNQPNFSDVASISRFSGMASRIAVKFNSETSREQALNIERSKKGVEPRGFEPLTSSMPLRRSTN